MAFLKFPPGFDGSNEPFQDHNRILKGFSCAPAVGFFCGEMNTPDSGVAYEGFDLERD